MLFRSFELEKKVESLSRQLSETKATAKIAEYRSLAIQQLLEETSATKLDVRSRIVALQKKDFQVQSDADDRSRNLTTSNGPATLGQIAIVEGRVSKDGTELENEEIIGSKPELGKDELFKGIDEAILGMNVNESKTATFKVKDQEYTFNFRLLGLRDKPAKTTEGTSEEAKANE